MLTCGLGNLRTDFEIIRNFGIVGHVLLLVTLGIAPAYGADLFLERTVAAARYTAA